MNLQGDLLYVRPLHHAQHLALIGLAFARLREDFDTLAHQQPGHIGLGHIHAHAQ